jgi:hypothetical protein
MMDNATNPIAEILDTFFNGRPAPKRVPKKVRIALPAAQLAELLAGKRLRFKAGEVEFTIEVQHAGAR